MYPYGTMVTFISNMFPIAPTYENKCNNDARKETMQRNKMPQWNKSGCICPKGIIPFHISPRKNLPFY